MKLALTLCLLASLLGPEPGLAESSDGDVLMYRGDPGRTGQMPGPGPAGPPKILWEFQTLGPFPTLSLLAIHDGVAYYALMDRGPLLAVDIQTGTEIWRTPVVLEDSPTVYWRPVVDHGLVYMNLRSGLVAFDAATGVEVWRTGLTLPEFSGSDEFLVALDALLVVATLGDVYGLDPKTGEEQWSVSTGSPDTVHVLVNDNVVYATSHAGAIVAIDSASGGELWRTEIAEAIPGAAISYGDAIIVETDAGTLWVIDKVSGEDRSLDTLRPGAEWFTSGTVSDGLFLANRQQAVEATDIESGAQSWDYTSPAERIAIVTTVDSVVVAETAEGLVGIDSSSGEEMWRSGFTFGYGTSWDSVKVSGGVVYASNAFSTAIALNLQTGRILWQFGEQATVEPESDSFSGSIVPPATGPPFSTSLVVAGDLVAFISENMLYGLDVSTGHERWRFGPGGSTVSQPVLADGSLYFHARDRLVYALSAANGRMQWNAPSGNDFGDALAIANDQILFESSGDGVWSLATESGARHTGFAIEGFSPAPPVVISGVVFWLGFDGVLAALDVRSGQTIWQAQTDADFLNGGMALYSGLIFVAEEAGVVTAFDGTTGQRVWTREIGESSFGLAASMGRVYISYSNVGSYIEALDATTGNAIWTVQVPESGGYLTIPTVADGIVAVAGYGGYVVGLDAQSGTERWRFETKQDRVSSPVVSQGVLYCGADNGTLYAIDLQSGMELWNIDLGPHELGEPIVSGGVVYVGSSGGVTYAVG